MEKSDEIEPPLITAIRLARMRDGNMGQSEEIKALMDILRGSENLLNITNDTVWSLITKKKGMSQDHKKFLFEESFKILTEALEKFVDAKTKRIEKFIKYFQILHQSVSDELEELKQFEKEWDDVKRELSKFDLNYFLNRSGDDSFNQTNQFKNNVVQTSLPILEKLTSLENKMQKRVLNMIAFIATSNKPVNSNELYKLLTADP
ncbi:MAG: hypothetical protein ACE5RC_04810 [Nitrosopumilus sp.]